MWWSSGICIDSSVDFWLLCSDVVEVNIVVGLFVSVLLIYLVFSLFRKCFIGVVMLLKWVGLFRIRLLYLVRFFMFMYGVFFLGIGGCVVWVIVVIGGIVCRCVFMLGILLMFCVIWWVSWVIELLWL